MRKTLKMSFEEIAPERAGFIACAISAYSIERDDALRWPHIGLNMRVFDSLNRAISYEKITKKETILVAKYEFGLTNSAIRDIISCIFD